MDAMRIALTPGEPAGIGPDLAIRIAQEVQAHQIVAIADPDMLRERADRLGMPLELRSVDYRGVPETAPPGCLYIDALTCAQPPEPGTLNAANAAYVLRTLDRAVDRCRAGDCAAMVTGPVHKAIINNAGFSFAGHTGYLAARCGDGEPVMMLATEDDALRVALATVHIPLAAVPGALTRPMLEHTVDVTAAGLQQRFGIANPRLLVAGLNPHAGENGYLGREEIDIIEPAIRAVRTRGLNVIGPLPADTLFTPQRLAGADAVIAMYHDQGLPVIKHLGFGRTVNISLGLSIIRTSVDHGTALELAGRDGVATGSLQAAVHTASRMAEATHGP